MSTTDLVPFTVNSGIAVARVSDKAPSAIMKVENTQNNSGIDNSIMQVEGPKQLYIAIAPNLTGPELTGTIKQVTLSVEGVSHVNKLVQAAANDTEEQFGLGTMSKLQTFEFDIDLTATNSGLYDFYGAMNSNSIGLFSEVLKFKFASCKATGTNCC